MPEHGLYTVQMRPIQYALFHEHWWHGRIYTERDGSGRSLTKKERPTIQFNSAPSVERDYSAMHPRLAYHLRGLEFRGDPYRLWNDDTSMAQRDLAKLVINAGLNANSRSDAIGACFETIRLKTKEGRWKRGNKLERAMRMGNALREIIGAQTNDFYKQARAIIADTYDLAIACHQPIEPDFGADAGASLMRVESSIALDVLYHFAVKGVPAIGVHDSFIVPESRGDELLQVMQECYQVKLGFDPVVK